MIDYSQEVSNVKKYFADLLILQYRNKPKARAMIEECANLYLCEGLIFQLQDILNIDIAEGAQLDIIGKILHCPRNIQGLTIDKKYFSFEKTGAIGFSTKDELRGGMFKTAWNSTLSIYSLSDTEYRVLLKFKALANVWRASMASMDDYLFNAFGTDIKMINNKDLTITFQVKSSLAVPLSAAIKLKYIRAPLGVSYNYEYV